MRRWDGLVVLALVAGACGGGGGAGESADTTTSIGVTTTSRPTTTEPSSTATTSVASSTTSREPPPTTTTTVTPSTSQPGLASVKRPSLVSGITAFNHLSLTPTEQINDRDAVPLVDRILVSPPDGAGMVTVTGQAGAVPLGQPDRPWDSVIVVAVEWGTQDCVDRRSDGSFDAQLEAPVGSTLYVMPIERGHCVGQGIQTGPAAVLAVPGTSSIAPDSGSFATLGRAGSELKWSAQGSLTGPGRSVEFVVHDGPGEECLMPRIHLYRLFDAEGGYVTQVNVNVHGPVLTPTGLPIESSEGASGFYEVLEFVDASDCLRSDQALTPDVLPESLEAGWYLPRIVFGIRYPGDDEVYVDRWTNIPPAGGLDFEGNTGFGYLPMFSVGTSAVPRVPATLLNEAPSWGAAGIRGVVANGDTGRFALGSRRSFAGPFIASSTDPLSGQSVHYTLEPYLPTVGYTGFAAQMPEPLFRLDVDDPGRLSISLTTPDGNTRDLAQDADVEMFIAAAWFAGYPVQLPFSGPSHTVGLTTRLDALDMEFDQFGLHTVRIDGTLQSSRGDRFVIEGSYDIWVAEPLDLSLGVFEGTPLEVGDAWNPTVIVEPGVPAEVTLEISHYPDGDPGRLETHTVSGTANRFGYFASDQAWRPTEHGEYRVDVTASYVDPVDGTLWMGARSSASIVATPDTPMIAHGERNSELARATGDLLLRTWFFNRRTDLECDEEVCDPDSDESGLEYPFFSGDVVWLLDGRPIIPVVTFDGPADFFPPFPNLGEATYCFPEGCVEAPDTHSLLSDTSEGLGTHQRPDDVTSWAYWYSTSIRADISVFSAVAEGKGGEHIHWYGHDSYSCQIGLVCRDFYFTPPQGGRRGNDAKGDEEGDVKLLFGGAVLKTADEQHFLPYASMSVIIEESSSSESGDLTFGDDKGGRICPPYQGAVGGLGTCGPLLTHYGRDVDLFITPTGTRPGNVLEPGDLFTFSGQTWPTLDVAVEVTVTGPDGDVRQFVNRANAVGYVDAEGMSFVVEEPGVYEVHVSAIQDRPVPSTGLAPDPALVADGRTTMDAYGYQDPLSAVLGSLDSTYRFYVVEEFGNSPIGSHISVLYGEPGEFSIYGWPGSYVEKVTFDYELPPGANGGHYSLTAPGLLIEEGTTPESGKFALEVDQGDLYDAGFTQIILGADTLQLSIAYETAGGWEAQILNQRGFSPLGGRVSGTG